MLFNTIGVPNPQWISINNAVYVCYNCAGIHRGFGVQISFIRSLFMDNITDKQKKIMSIGGNKRFREFMETYNLNTDPNKYKTKAAEFYRGTLKALIERSDFNEEIPGIKEGKEIIKGFKKPITDRKQSQGMLKSINEFSEVYKNSVILKKGRSIKVFLFNFIGKYNKLKK